MPIFLVHEISVVNDLSNLCQYRIFQGILLEKGFKRAVFPMVRKPGSCYVEQLSLIWSLLHILKEGEGSLRVYEALYQPDAARAVYVASLSGGPEHQPPLSAPISSASPPCLTAPRAAFSAEAASFLKGDRK